MLPVLRLLSRLFAHLVLLLLVLLPQSSAAQTRPGLVGFQRIALPEDAPAQLSTTLLQDRRGLLWIGTQDGLVRWDGYGARVYRPKPGDPRTLSAGYVRGLLEARDGRLWISTVSGGLNVLEPDTGRIHHYRHDPAHADSIAHDRGEDLVEDRDGRIWLATEAGLDRLDPASGRFEHFRHDAADEGSLAHDSIRALLIDRDGRLWVGTRDGLQRREASGRFVRIASGPGEPLAGQQITRLMQDSRGRIWIGTFKQGAAVYDPASGELHTFSPQGQGAKRLSHYWVFALAEGPGGEIWIGTFGAGVDIVDPDTLQVIDRLRHDSADNSTIGGDRIGALLRDRSGLMWVGTWGGGLAHHDASTRAWRKLRHRADDPASISHGSVVRALESVDGRLWLGTNGRGLDVLDAEGRRLATFAPDPTRPGALADGSVSCLAEGPDGSIWVGTLDGSLQRLRRGTRSFERWGKAQGLSGGVVRSMLLDADGALWIGASGGLSRIDAQGRVKAWVHRKDDPASLSGEAVESLAFMPDGRLWIGTNDGLNVLDPSSGHLLRIQRDANRTDGLPDNWVPDLLVTRDGHLWLTTPGGTAMLSSFDGRQARFELLNQRLDLPTAMPESLIEDAGGRVWLGSRVRIDPRTWQVDRFGPAEGNEFRSFYIASRSRNRNGALMFGSQEGLLIVQPAQLAPWRFEPPVNLGRVLVDGKPQVGRSLVMQPQQQSLRVEFSAQDFSAPALLRYRYRLEGFDHDWLDAAADQRLAAYSGLPPGDYRLRVQASNRAGKWSPQEATLTLRVEPAWYQTWWCRLAAGLATGMSLWGLLRLRLRSLRLRGERLEALVDERTADLQDAYQRIEAASLSDALTGLHNRRFLEQAMPADFELAQRRQGDPAHADEANLLLLMLDLDHFKQVNDRYGHAAGDAVLVQTGQLLRQALRASDHVVRWGGEEFLVVARFVERGAGAQLAEKIRAAVAGHAFELPDDRQLRCTVSVGFSCWPFQPGRGAPGRLDLLHRVADAGLYAAKRNWRDAWVGVEFTQEAGADAVEHFLSDPAGAAAAGTVRPQVPAGRDGLVWK